MRQPTRGEIIIGLIIFTLCLAFSVSHAYYQGNSISEQSNVGSRYFHYKTYHGLYGFRAQMYTPVYGNLYRDTKGYEYDKLYDNIRRLSTPYRRWNR